MNWIEGSPGEQVECSRHIKIGNGMVVAVSGSCPGFWGWDVYGPNIPSPEDRRRLHCVGRCRAMFTSKDDAIRDAEYYIEGRTTVGGDFMQETKTKRFSDGTLVLKRKENERISVGNDIKVVVTEISRDGGWVKIGIIAPVNIKVLREELVGVTKGV